MILCSAVVAHADHTGWGLGSQQEASSSLALLPSCDFTWVFPTDFLVFPSKNGLFKLNFWETRSAISVFSGAYSMDISAEFELSLGAGLTHFQHEGQTEYLWSNCRHWTTEEAVSSFPPATACSVTQALWRSFLNYRIKSATTKERSWFLMALV